MGPSITSRKISGDNTTNILLDTFVLYNTEKDGRPYYNVTKFKTNDLH